MNPEDLQDKAKVKKLKEELVGHPVVDLIPFDIHEELSRDSLELSPQEWSKHSPEEQGRMMAVYEIKNKIELLERAESALARNRKDAASGTSKNSKSGS